MGLYETLAALNVSLTQEADPDELRAYLAEHGDAKLEMVTPLDADDWRRIDEGLRANGYTIVLIS